MWSESTRTVNTDPKCAVKDLTNSKAGWGDGVVLLLVDAAVLVVLPGLVSTGKRFQNFTIPLVSPVMIYECLLDTVTQVIVAACIYEI